MTLPVPQQLLNQKNREVLDYLEPLSCHGDNIEPLQEILASYPEVESFCPDSKNYRYFLWYVDDVVFAYGVGMRNVCLRIPPASADLAIDIGTDNVQFDGETWCSFSYDCEQLHQMVKLSYDHAKL